MVAETEHKKGEEGALIVKQWLESTTFVNITFTVYDDETQTTLLRLDKVKKRYDLVGVFLGDNGRPLYVEVKNYNVVGRQPAEYAEFLANAYSTTAVGINDDLDARRDYMWVTWHPFDQTKWAKLDSEDEIRAALVKYPEVLDGGTIDDQIVRMVAERLWLVILSRRHPELLLSREELLQVYTVIARKGIG